MRWNVPHGWESRADSGEPDAIGPPRAGPPPEEADPIRSDRRSGEFRLAFEWLHVLGFDDQVGEDTVEPAGDPPVLLAEFRWSTFWEWLPELPDEIVARHPMIATARVTPALARGDFSEGLHWIGVAESAIANAPDELRPAYETTVDLYRAFCELAAGDKGVAHAELGEIADKLRLTGSRSYPIAIGLAGMATFWSVGGLESIPALREAAVAREMASLPDGGVTALLAAAYAETGDMTAAERAAEAALALPSPWAHYSYPDPMAAHYAMGKVHIARGERDQGIAHIEQGLDLARGWVEPIFVAYGCLALAGALDEYSEKRTLVREARQLVEESSDPARVRDLVVAAERRLSMRQPQLRTESTVLVEPLTDREGDVLCLLRSELTLREIADELYISHNTVKGYTKAIYRKLGVSSREAAIEPARETNVS
jgi:LuxR family maltose regulon positive regulatory protein